MTGTRITDMPLFVGDTPASGFVAPVVTPDESSGTNYKFDVGAALAGKASLTALAATTGAALIGTTSGDTVQQALDANSFPVTEIAPYGDYHLSTAAGIWLGEGTVSNSSLPYLVVSRTIDDDDIGIPNYHCFTDSAQINLGNAKAYNSYDARVTLGGSGAADHYAPFQTGVVKQGSGSYVNLFNYYCGVQVTAGEIENVYGLFFQQPEITMGATLGRAVGLLFNGIPRDYGNPANPNYLFYSNGSGGTAAPAYTAGLFTAANIVASAAEITAGAMIHANTPDGTQCSVRIQQQSQNWWDWRIPASQSYLSLFNAIGGGSGTEWLRIAANPGHFSPGTVNAQDCGTDALPWRTIHADTGLSIQGIKVVGTQQAAIPNPTGGATVDAESRTAIDAILAALEAHGLIAT